MLEWLKTILGDNYSEDIDKKVSAEIGKAFVARTDFNALNEEKKGLVTQVSERDAQLESLKKLDPEKLQAEITRLQGENTTAKQKYESDLSAIKRDNALDMALVTAKAKNSKAVKALLNMDDIKLDGDKLLGFDTQMEKIKTESGYLFEGDAKQDTTVTASSGGQHQEPLNGDADKFVAAAMKGAGIQVESK